MKISILLVSLSLLFGFSAKSQCSAEISANVYSCDSAWFAPVTYNSGAYYSWNFGDGTYSNNPYNNHVYAADGDYFVWLTVIDSLNNCSATDSVWVNVWCDSITTDSCNADFYYSNVTCDSVWFVVSDYSPTAYYSWNFGDGAYADGSSTAHIFADGSYAVTLTIIDSLNNCWNTTTNWVSVWCDSTVTDSCNADFYYSNVTCDSVWFVVSDYSPTAYYSWNFGDGAYADGSSTAHIFADGAYAVTLTVIDSLNNCWNTTTNWVSVWCDSITTDSCNAAFDYYYITCDSVWMMPTYYSPSADYVWDFGDGTVSYASSSAHAFAGDGVYEVTLTVVDSLNNCWNTSTNWVGVWCDSTVTDSCSAGFYYAYVTCDSVWFVVADYSPTAYYSWDFGDGGYADGSSTAHIFADGAYAVTLTVMDSLNNCWNMSTDWVYVWCDSTITDSCSAEFDYAFVTCETVWFAPEFYNPSASYNWDFGNGTTGYDPFINGYYPTAGLYTVTLTVIDSLNGCMQTSTQQIYINCDSTTLQVTEPGLMTDIQVYPNPGTGIFYVELPVKNAIIQVYDLAGNMVSDITCAEDCDYITLDLTELAKGTYSLLLIHENGVETRKIIKQ